MGIDLYALMNLPDTAIKIITELKKQNECTEVYRFWIKSVVVMWYYETV